MNDTQANTVAIAEVVVVVKQLTKDVDKMVTHLDIVPVVRVLSLEARMKNLEVACNKRSWWAFTTIVAILGLFAYKHFFGVAQ